MAGLTQGRSWGPLLPALRLADSTTICQPRLARPAFEVPTSHHLLIAKDRRQQASAVHCAGCLTTLDRHLTDTDTGTDTHKAQQHHQPRQTTTMSSTPTASGSAGGALPLRSALKTDDDSERSATATPSGPAKGWFPVSFALPESAPRKVVTRHNISVG